MREDGGVGYYDGDDLVFVHPTNLSIAKSETLGQLYSVRDGVIYSSVTDAQGRAWLYTPATETLIANAMILALAGVAQQFPWQLLDGSVIVATLDDFKDVAGIAAARKVQCYTIEQAKSAAIRGATSHEELLAIDLYSEWPT